MATVRGLIREGATVVAAARTISEELAQIGALTVATDLTTPDAPDQLVAEAVHAFGGVDLLVNNLGGGQPRRPGTVR